MIFNTHEEVIRAIKALDEEYFKHEKKHLTYTIESLKDAEMMLEYTIKLWDFPHWFSRSLEPNLACYFGECLVRIFGGKWMFETGRYADNSRLRVQLNGVMYYPEDFIERSWRENFVISELIDKLTDKKNKCIFVDFKQK